MSLLYGFVCVVINFAQQDICVRTHLDNCLLDCKWKKYDIIFHHRKVFVGYPLDLFCIGVRKKFSIIS
ncbi:hypothetical protein HN51_013288 [Arachis hypogaea]